MVPFSFCLLISFMLYISIVWLGWAETNFPPYNLITNKENDTRDKDKSLTSKKEV